MATRCNLPANGADDDDDDDEDDELGRGGRNSRSQYTGSVRASGLSGASVLRPKLTTSSSRDACRDESQFFFIA